MGLYFFTMRVTSALCVFSLPCHPGLLTAIPGKDVLPTPDLVTLALSLPVGMYHPMRFDVTTHLSLKGGNVGTRVGVTASRGVKETDGKRGRDTERGT